MKRLIMLCLTVLIFSFSTVHAEDTQPKVETSTTAPLFSVSSTALTLNEFDSVYFEITLADQQHKLQDIAVSIGNPDVVSVDLSGKRISGLKQGKTTLTFTLETTIITVDVDVLTTKAAITLGDESFYLIRGLGYTIPYTITPTQLQDKTITWSSSNSAVAKVENGRVVGISIGKTTITATVDGNSDSMTLYVTAPLAGIQFNPDTLALVMNETSRPISVLMTPQDTTDDVKVSYTVSDPSIVALNDDLTLTALKQGTTTVIAKAKDFTSELRVSVKSNANVNGNTVLELKENRLSSAQVEYSVIDTLNESQHKTYALMIPADTAASMLESQSLVSVTIKLNPLLIKDNYAVLKEVILPQEILSRLAGRKLIVTFQSTYGTTLISYTFSNPYSKPLNLVYTLSAFKAESSIGNLVNTNGYRLQFKDTGGFPLGTTVQFSGNLLDAKAAEKRYIYAYNDRLNTVEFTNQICEVNSSGLIEIEVESDNLVITNFKLRKSNGNTLYYVLTGLAFAVVAGMVYMTFKDKKKSSHSG